MLTQAVAECLCRQIHYRKDASPKRYISLTCNHIPQTRSIEAHSAMSFTSTVFKHIRRSAGVILWAGSKLYGMPSHCDRIANDLRMIFMPISAPRCTQCVDTAIASPMVCVCCLCRSRFQAVSNVFTMQLHRQQFACEVYDDLVSNLYAIFPH